jgi:hypothetical protein
VTAGSAERDWFEWHRRYDDPGSGLHRRLRAVQGVIADALDRHPPGPVRVMSVCAGQGRDLLGVLTDHPRRDDVVGRLVELDPRNVAVARAACSAAGLNQIDVVLGDGSIAAAYDGAVPADLVLVCGVFGHASDDDIESMIERLPMLCAARATVVWTRGAAVADLRPTIRGWFCDRGFEELGYAGADGAGWGVGAHRMVVDPEPFRPGVRLFTFVDDLRGL